MSDSPYAEALRDWDPLATTLHQAYHPAPANLPAVVPAPVVHQPVPLPERAPLIAPRDVRLVAVGLCGLCSGGGVFLVCAGIHLAGPYLWPATGLVGAVAMLIALLKGKTGPPPSGTTVNFNGGHNKVRRIG